MKVVVEILTGSLFNVEVGDDATLGDLKKEIATQQSLPEDRMMLMIGDDESRVVIDQEDGAALVDCGVQDGCHVYLFFNLPLEPPEGESDFRHVFT
ncbi:hypothetical protein CCACVL1_27198 [Corchorus capsularis]|uniref:Ubiquitin-like domain-containing protein n=1 Tax=Corchorus capsularis TaxID=210143 RepID=A0A1R3GBU2_COCAP|nr:hypothetical protein CCACVL1_27198 [Corchorus capsularis]